MVHFSLSPITPSYHTHMGCVGQSGERLEEKEGE